MCGLGAGGVGDAQAAEMYVSIDAFREAVDVYAQANMWDKARQIGQHQPQLSGYVEQQYTQHLTKTGQADQLATTGNTSAALDLYVRQGEWDKVHQLAAEQGPEAMGKYAYMHAKVEAQRGSCKSALPAGPASRPGIHVLLVFVRIAVFKSVEVLESGARWSLDSEGDVDPVCLHTQSCRKRFDRLTPRLSPLHRRSGCVVQERRAAKIRVL